MEDYKIEIVKIKEENEINVIIGRTHFIKTIEDLYEAIVEINPSIKFGIAFNEASGDRLIRVEGNDEEMKKMAIEAADKVSAGHTFFIFMKNGWPINVLNRIKMVSEVTSIIAATANELNVVIIKTEKGNGILGVIDGFKPLGVEQEKDIRKRKDFLRNIGYKR